MKRAVITCGVIFVALLLLIVLTSTYNSHRYHITSEVSPFPDHEYAYESVESKMYSPLYSYVAEEMSFEDMGNIEYSFKEYPECRKYPIVKDYPNATCLGRCTAACDETVISGEIKANRAELICTAKIFLIGFHKCGSSDISDWFKQHPDVFWRIGDMFYLPEEHKLITDQCPIESLKRPDLAFHTSADLYLQKGRHYTIYQDCPGCLRAGQVLKDEKTGIYEVVKPAIFLEKIYTQDQKFIVSIRNPTDRFISEYFYHHKMHLLFPNLTKEQVGYDKLHYQVDVGISFLSECLRKIGAVVCGERVYHQHPPPVQSLPGLVGGWYSTYLKEFLKYIPRDQVVFNQLEEYAKDQASAIKRIFTFVDLATYPVDEIMINKKLINGGYLTKPVYKETRQLLVELYRPFNEELADLLNDNKWLYLELKDE